MKEPIFNLLTEPWIITTTLQGNEETLSLTEVLTRSHEIKSLSGEMPAQDMAIFRLLLGVLYAIYTRTEKYSEAQDATSKDMCINIWKELWERGYFFSNEIVEYLEQYYDRFWLVHPERPFYQVAKIQTTKPYAVSKMIGELVESNNKIQLFPLRSGESKQFLEYPEAARWLLYLNCFDDAALKKFDSTTSSISVGWLGQLGLVYIVGKNLFETLMLNLVLLNNGEPWGQGKATWELSESRTGERTAITTPGSAEELYTLQSRRIKLIWDSDRLTGYEILGGDYFSKEDAFVEPMTLWKLCKGKAGHKDMYIPPSNVARDFTKQLWRDITPLLVNSESARCPGVIDWLSELKQEGIISSRQIQICTLFIKYGGGSNMSGVDEIWSDSISINANLLSSMSDEWIGRITSLVAITEQLVKLLGDLASNIAMSAGASEGNAARNAAKEQAYADLDIPFRNWLSEIDPDADDINVQSAKWISSCKKIIFNSGDELISKAGEQAFIGRSLKIGNKESYYSTPRVYGWFVRGVYKIVHEEGFEK